MKKVNFSLGTFEYKPPLMIYRFTKDGALDEPEMKRMVADRNKLMGDKPVVVISVLTAIVDFSDEALEIAALPETTRNIIAHAVVVKWLGQRLIAEVFRSVKQPSYPVRAFDNESEALIWLMEQWKHRQN